jgi:hypothetical protein
MTTPQGAIELTRMNLTGANEAEKNDHIFACHEAIRSLCERIKTDGHVIISKEHIIEEVIRQANESKHGRFDGVKGTEWQSDENPVPKTLVCPWCRKLPVVDPEGNFVRKAYCLNPDCPGYGHIVELDKWNQPR